MTRVAIVTFGCQMNQHDSERLAEVLVRAGAELCEQAETADVVVVNTCSVREKAEQKLRSEVGRLGRLKRERRELVLVVAGCMAQQEGDALLGRFPQIDLVLGPDNLRELPALLAEIERGAPPSAHTVFDLDAPAFLTAPTVNDGRATAFVTTMKGCDERCSFCVVPYTRGPERYRPSDDVVAEIAELVARGVREVTLLGQTVNSYRDPSGKLPRSDEANEFAALLRRIAADVPALARLRYTSPHPRHLTAALIAAHRELAILPRHVHLPVQSGSDRMLKRMIRRHTRAEYLARLCDLRREVEGCTVSTDVIVGFPGESEEDFAQTLSLIEEARHTGVFGFKYSARPNTPALRLEDDVPEAVKAERLARLFATSERLLGEHLASLVGSVQQVLIEGPSKSRPLNLTGRSGRHEIVHVEGCAGLDLVGAIVPVTIVSAYRHSLLGRIDEATRARAGRLEGTRRRALPVLALTAE